MRFTRPDSSTVHLVYCTNVHPAESLDDVMQGLANVTLPLKQRLAPDRPFGVGLYLARAAARELVADDAKLRHLAAWLDEHGLYVPTLNAFPIGGFHGERVKEKVFLPRWHEKERIEYTRDCLTVLAHLLPAGVPGSISTHTGGLKPYGAERNERFQALSGMGEIAALMHGVLEEQEKELALALEPEPFAMLESVAEVADFFDDLVLKRGSEFFIKELDITLPEAREAIPDRLGLCLDACHVALQYEDVESIRRALQGELRVHKFQISSAIEVLDPKNKQAHAALKAYDEPRWFHQVIGQGAGDKRKALLDLDELVGKGPGFFWKRLSSWRVHFHVPVFVESLGALGTTQATLRDLLAASLTERWCDLYEIETYTFDKLPEEARSGIASDDLVGCLEREYHWTLERFAEAGLVAAS